MRPIILDTNAYAAFKRGDESVFEVIQQAGEIAVSPIMLGELLAGFGGGNRAKKNKEELKKFLDSSRVKLYSITSDTAQFFGQVYTSLKTKGRPIPTNDMWIAAQALEHGFVVCTYDKHFKEIEGLIIGHAIRDLFV